MRVGACALFIRDGRILLGHRSPGRAYYPDVWDLIGGHLRQAESPELAMIREVREEVGSIPTRFRYIQTIQEPDPGLNGPGEFHIFLERLVRRTADQKLRTRYARVVHGSRGVSTTAR
ncbi:MAG: NUDIX hydrolase [Gammaproteobacteria bacterium]